MKKLKFMSLHANESVMKEAAKGISSKRNKKLYLTLLLCITLFINSCNKEGYDVIENDDVIENTNNSSLEVRDFKNWFESQNVAEGLIGEQEPDWSNAELKMMRDGKTLHVAIEIYKGKNFLGNDSIRKLQIAKVKNGFTGGVFVFSSYIEEYAHAKYYNFNGQILDEGVYYYAPEQLYISLKRYTYTNKWSPVRLKSGNEPNDNSYADTIDPCAETDTIGVATPYSIDGEPNPNASNCHYYVWGPSDTAYCYTPGRPMWNECPEGNINASGYSGVTTGPQVGDRWVSYGYHPVYGNNTPIHSAFVQEVVNGKVTKLRAKNGDGPPVIYNPDCSAFSEYITDSIVYYR